MYIEPLLLGIYSCWNLLGFIHHLFDLLLSVHTAGIYDSLDCDSKALTDKQLLSKEVRKMLMQHICKLAGWEMPRWPLYSPTKEQKQSMGRYKTTLFSLNLTFSQNWLKPRLVQGRNTDIPTKFATEKLFVVNKPFNIRQRFFLFFFHFGPKRECARNSSKALAKFRWELESPAKWADNELRSWSQILAVTHRMGRQIREHSN